MAPINWPLSSSRFCMFLPFFKPTTWGFFLGANAGLAWMWWSMVLGFFYVFFLLFMLISRNRFLPFHDGQSFVAFFSSFPVLEHARVRNPDLHGAGSSIVCIPDVQRRQKGHTCKRRTSRLVLRLLHAQFHLPPYQVSLAYLLVFMLAGFIADRHSQLALRHAGLVRLSSLAISLRSLYLPSQSSILMPGKSSISWPRPSIPEPALRLVEISSPGSCSAMIFLSPLCVLQTWGSCPLTGHWADMDNICDMPPSSSCFLF